MNCQDAREGFSALFHGGLGLTEWALLEAHVRQCVECGKARESVQGAVNARQQVTPSRALLHRLSKTIDAIRLETTLLAAWLTRLGVPLAVSLIEARLAVIEASRVAATWIVDALTRVRRLLPRLFKRFVSAAETAIATSGFVITGFGDLLAGLSSASLIGFKWAARPAIEGAKAGVTRLLDVLLLVRWLLQAAVRKIEASHVGVTWVLWERPAVKAIRATRVVGRIVATTFGRARSRTRSRESLTGIRIRVSTGIASLAILVATIGFLWPREWPGNLPPKDRKPVEPAAAQLAEAHTPKSVSAPQPAPAPVSPNTRRVTIRPRPPERQAEIPAPLWTPDPALAQRRAAASVQTPTPETAWSPEPSRLQESARSQDRARPPDAHGAE